MHIFHILPLILLIHKLSGAPPAKRVQNGPCIGMDCLHGILMHGDEEEGKDHKMDDEEEIVKNKEKFKEKRPGPCEGLDCLHGVLMHNDQELGNHHSEDDMKHLENKQQFIVESPDFILHGDKDAHKERPNYDLDEKKDYAVELESLLHGDEEQNVHVDNIEKEKRISGKDLPKEDHNSPSKEQQNNEVGVPLVFDPDSFLHGEHQRRDTKLRFHKIKTRTKTVWDLLTGWSLPFISDSIASDYDTLKKRYTKENVDGVVASDESYRNEKEHGSNELADFDPRHDLGDIGNTAPINIKHKVHKIVKEKLRKEHDES